MTSRVDQFVKSMNQWQPPAQTSQNDEVIMAESVGPAPEELLDPTVLASIGGMDFVSRTVVDGVMSGIHRSTHKGGCSEFEDHRPYSNGDELRHIDWRLLARRDRYYIKQFTDETNLQGWIALDSSGSMQFGMSTVSKYDYARTAAACLARLLLKQRDSVGLSLQVNDRQVFLPARPRSSHFQLMLQQLVRTSPSGSKGVEATLDTLAGRIKRRGLVMVFSDCLGDIDVLAQRLRNLRSRGNDVILFQILAPEEVTFDFRGNAEFQDLEGVNPRLEIDTGSIRKAYLEQFQNHMERLDEAIRKSACDHIVMTTDQPLSDVLSAYLLRRQAMSRKG